MRKIRPEEFVNSGNEKWLQYRKIPRTRIRTSTNILFKIKKREWYKPSLDIAINLRDIVLFNTRLVN